MTAPLQNHPANELPREKLLNRGPASLSDAELLAILLRTGYKGVSVIEFAATLIRHFSSLDALLSASNKELRSIKGLGNAKTAELQAILEICRRVLQQKAQSGDVMANPDNTRQYLQLHFRDQERELFACMFLDTRHRVLALETLFQGTVDSAAVYPREILKRALELNASAVILSHNHPSGNPEPSQADIRITRTIRSALELIDIQLLDHMIIGKGATISLAERGLV